MALAEASLVLESKTNDLPSSQWSQSGFYALQLGAFNKKSNAKILVSRFKQRGYPVFYREEDALFKVYCGQSKEMNELLVLKKELIRDLKWQTVLVKLDEEKIEDVSFSEPQFSEAQKIDAPVFDAPKKSYQWLFGFSIGQNMVQKGQGQFLSLIPPFENYYAVTDKQETVFDSGVFFGMEHLIHDNYMLQLGLSANFDQDLKPHGEVWQFSLPEFNTLAYRYYISHKRFMLEGKFYQIWSSQPHLLPYLSMSLGAALNKSINYLESPLVRGAIPGLAFADHLRTSLSWGLGLGFDYKPEAHIRLGLGFQFSDLGSASLGATPASTTKQTLSIDHLYAAQIRGQLTLLF